MEQHWGQCLGECYPQCIGRYIYDIIYQRTTLPIGLGDFVPGKLGQEGLPGLPFVNDSGSIIWGKQNKK